MISFNALYGRTSGVAVIQDKQLVFTSDQDGQQIILPLSNLQVRLEGINSHHFYFFDPLKPEVRICIQDNKVLKLLSEKGVHSVESILNHSEKLKFRRFLFVSSPVVLTISLLIGLPFLLSMIPFSWVGSFLSTSQEKTLGRWLFPMVQHQYSVQENHPAEMMIRSLIQHLKTANPEIQNFDLETYISTSREVNAFSAPGGYIILNRGLVEQSESIEEVIGVLAHEIGHVEQKHSIKSLAGGVGSLMGTMILGTIIGYDAAITLTQATSFLNLHYSREDEYKADQRAILFLQRAGVSTKGLIHFFEKLASQNNKLEGSLNLLSTHPSSIDRVQALNELSKNNFNSQMRPLPVSLQELKEVF